MYKIPNLTIFSSLNQSSSLQAERSVALHLNIQSYRLKKTKKGIKDYKKKKLITRFVAKIEKKRRTREKIVASQIFLEKFQDFNRDEYPEKVKEYIRKYLPKIVRMHYFETKKVSLGLTKALTSAQTPYLHGVHGVRPASRPLLKQPLSKSFNVKNAKTMLALLKRLENLEKNQKSSIKLEAAIYHWYAKEFERITKNSFLSYNNDGNTLIRHTEILEKLMIALSDKVNRLKIDLKEIQKEKRKWLKYIVKRDFYNHRLKGLRRKEIKKLEEKKKEKERYVRLIKISKNIIIELNKIESIVPKQCEAIKNKLSKILFKKLSKRNLQRSVQRSLQKLKRVDDKKIRLSGALVAERPSPRKTKSISKAKLQRDYTVEKKKKDYSS